MKLEQQVCSLELAKRLKELGVKQESFLWYEPAGDSFVNTHPYTWVTLIPERRSKAISAFNVAELGEMLPEHFDLGSKYVSGNRAHLEIKFTGRRWILWYSSYHHYIEYNGSVEGGPSHHSTYSESPEFIDENEANARAKMLIYLLESKLLPASKSGDERI